MSGTARAARTRGGAVVGAVLAVLALGGCTAPAAPTVAAPTVSRAAPASPTADAELSRFAATAEAVVRQQQDPGGMDFVRALRRAGYARSALQVTADRTSVGLAVPAVQFAARSDGSCLIGQYGDAGLQVLRAAPVDGACLIGGTRSLG